EEEDEYRHLEHQRHTQDHVDKQIEIVFDRDDRTDVDPLANTQQEFQAETESDKVSEASAEDEQSGGADDKRRGPAALAFVQAWSDKAPDLIKDPRRGEEDRRQNRQLDPHDVEDIHRRKLHELRRIVTQPAQRVFGRLLHEHPQLVAEGKAAYESDTHAHQHADDPGTQLFQVFEEGHAQHAVFFVVPPIVRRL